MCKLEYILQGSIAKVVEYRSTYIFELDIFQKSALNIILLSPRCYNRFSIIMGPFK